METENLCRNNLCCECVGESFLSGEIRRDGKSLKCSYCGKRGPTFNLERLSARVQEALEEYYCPTPDPVYEDRFRSDWGNEPGLQTDEAIQLAAGVSEQIALDIQQILVEAHFDRDAWQCGEENPFSSDIRYTLKTVDDTSWHEDWSSFAKELTTETRLCSPYAIQFLNTIFDGIEGEQTAEGVPVVTTAGPQGHFTEVFRARCFQSDEELKQALAYPDLHLGLPPPTHARAGRMNADGIAVFYGAVDPTVALAEVRPPVGSRVVVARFTITRPLKLLDLKALNDIDCRRSVFERGNSRRLERGAFLSHLSGLLAQPVMPDRERFEYLPTQAIADYLATRAEGRLDGIVFPSIQAGAGALNLVLFHRAARVHNIEIPRGTKVTVMGGYRHPKFGASEHSVYEAVPCKEEGKPPVSEVPLWAFPVDEDLDSRKPALQIDLDSICVHYVQVVRFDTDKHIVRRFRREKELWD